MKQLTETTAKIEADIIDFHGPDNGSKDTFDLGQKLILDDSNPISKPSLKSIFEKRQIKEKNHVQILDAEISNKAGQEESIDSNALMASPDQTTMRSGIEED